jgi:hypothetical protein
VRAVHSDYPRIEELARRCIELRSRCLVDQFGSQFGATPRVDEDVALGMKQSSVRAFEWRQPNPLFYRQVRLDITSEAHACHRIAPEGAASFFEPRVLRSKGACTHLELRPHLGYARRRLGRAPKLDDPGDRLEHSHPGRHRWSRGVPCCEVSRFENRLFFPQAVLDEWIVEEAVDLHDGVLNVLSEGRRFRVTEAVRILREVSGGGDAHDLVGRAKPRQELEQAGAEIMETSMLLGETAYDVEPGWLAVPAGSFKEYLASGARAARKDARQGRTGPEPKTDEELLERLMGKNL